LAQNPPETPVVLIIADISGFTRLVAARKMTLLHSQYIITQLLEAVIAQVEIPMQVMEVEGDAVFLCTPKQSRSLSWDRIRQEIGAKLLAFLEAFSAKLAELIAANTCHCEACEHMAALKLKIIVHSGQVVLGQVAGFKSAHGPDVIVVHRLLKNSVQADEYILFSDPAWQDLALPADIQTIPTVENYPEIGQVPCRAWIEPLGRGHLEHLVHQHPPASGWAKLKDGMAKMAATLALSLGLKKPRPFRHLPSSPQG
jgi:class 3 adenylate cyclase